MDDRELLRQFVTKNSQPAFRALVERHSDWLYSVCLRRLRDPGLAEDATQAVFLTLARKAPSLCERRTISPWLHEAAKFVASNMIRAGRRRARHELEAGAMNTSAAASGQGSVPSGWDAIEADLEPAIDRLRNRDRQAILLRFYERKSHAEIAGLLEISEAAAQKRLGRALERLRRVLSKSGGTTTLSAVDVGALLAAHVVGPAPASLVAALAGVSASTVPAHVVPLSKGIAYMMTMTKVKAAAVAAAVVLVAVPPSVIVVRSYAAAPPAAPPAAVQAPAAASAAPVDAVVALNDAILKCDPAAFAALHAPGTAEEDAYGRAVQTAIGAQGRFRAAYRTTIDPQDKAQIPPTSSLLAIPTIGDEKSLRASSVTAVDADTADVEVPGVLKYRVVRPAAGGAWRIQTGFSIASKYPTQVAKVTSVLTAMFNAMADAYDTTVGEINSGALTTPDAVSKALSERFAKIRQEAYAKIPAEPLTVPFKFANGTFVPAVPAKDYLVTTDPDVRRTPSSPPAGHIKSTARSPNMARLLCSIGPQATVPRDLAPLLGKRVRLTGWVKSRDAQNWGGIGMFVLGPDGKFFVTADNAEEPVLGTTDWRQFQLVADVPEKASAIYVSAFLRGAGELWADDFQLETVSNDVPVNDDQGWQKWSYVSPKFNFALDPAVQRNGHPTMCISSESALATQWCSYGRNDRNPEKYLGRRAIMTAWIKTENVTGRSGLWLRSVRGDNSQQLKFAEARPITGTTDWKQYSVIVDVPYETQCLSSSIVMFGKGKMWIDLESVKYDVLED